MAQHRHARIFCPVGQFESGMLASVIGGVPTVIAGGMIATLAAISWTWLFPSARYADRLEDKREESAIVSQGAS